LEPSPDFVKLAVQNFEDRNLTAGVLAEWKPILSSAIHEWAKQQMLTMAFDRAGNSQVGDRASLGHPESPHAPAKQNVPAKTRELRSGSPRVEPEAGAAARKAWETRRVSLKELVDAGVLKAPLKLIAQLKGKDFEAELVANDGAITFDGKSYATPSAAGVAATGRQTDGWQFWNWDNNGSHVPLDAARKAYLARRTS
jgi:hypothetical protein